MKINVLYKNIPSVHKNVDHLLFQKTDKIKNEKKYILISSV